MKTKHILSEGDLHTSFLPSSLSSFVVLLAGGFHQQCTLVHVSPIYGNGTNSIFLHSKTQTMSCFSIMLNQDTIDVFIGGGGSE